MTDTRTISQGRCMSCLRARRHSRTCPDLYVYEIYGPPVVPGYRLEDSYIITQDIPPPSMLPVGEIQLEDGQTMIIAQPQLLPNGGWQTLPSDTLDGSLSWTGVMDAFVEVPQSHAKGRTARGPMPVWPVVLILAGLVLMAIGFLLNGPVSLLVHGVISR